MATDDQNEPRSLAARKAAAKAAVTASKKTGRPVDPRVAELARDESTVGIDSAVAARVEAEHPRSPWNRIWRRRAKT